ncbi:SDR family NAD(P)-dependent oxidoreductase [Ferrimonas lipolytica]|uniref:SDR family NAD(P)-dependent oxidoreductase n=1 Tax=Ferrimonas lipolytica TaxID=2724191 RepID=A0A6H1UFQ2_9GAMM|nr:SDR family NAD(P)-dependent oxidoreductase [Ferrimonas lipolytica]QIZ77430.1 SDR family NAD(P)-dependent oxidoreductase [Ferrimonas lipolytica]
MSNLSAIIVGANSALSQQLALQLHQQGVKLGLMAADPSGLTKLQQQTDCRLVELDIRNAEQCQQAFNQLWQDLDGVALVVINTAANGLDLELPWQLDQAIIDVNVQGFAAIANAAFKQMEQQKFGQIGCFTSIAGERGGPQTAFHASKAFQQNYLQGLRLHAQRLKLPIIITDLRLGYLDKMHGRGKGIWAASLDKVVKQSLKALRRGKHTVYVTKRWRIAALMSKVLPEFIYNRRRYK